MSFYRSFRASISLRYFTTFLFFLQSIFFPTIIGLLLEKQQWNGRSERNNSHEQISVDENDSQSDSVVYKRVKENLLFPRTHSDKKKLTNFFFLFVRFEHYPVEKAPRNLTGKQNTARRKEPMAHRRLWMISFADKILHTDTYPRREKARTHTRLIADSFVEEVLVERYIYFMELFFPQLFLRFYGIFYCQIRTRWSSQNRLFFPVVP